MLQESMEAFLKLKEQVKCHYQNPNELHTGLDVISNTNLVYFATQQKAEFFTLKDLNLPKAWAEWGMFNDRRFKENPNDMVYANNAISCYLQAAGLYKNGKTRKLLARILWLISLDDASGTLAQAFDNFRGEGAKLQRVIHRPLHFQLRTTKEDFAAKQRQFMEISRQNSNRMANQGPGSGASATSNGDEKAPTSEDGEAPKLDAAESPSTNGKPEVEENANDGEQNEKNGTE
ncbi:hypothetical protein QCA50_016249 [Cerrena zonata]|uniref:PIK-related kinase FAT domain-containing protein n=1 Tax=Cerrena zonata TaxID=2478898 RepID=A0AAW0FIV3_9APHY